LTQISDLICLDSDLGFNTSVSARAYKTTNHTTQSVNGSCTVCNQKTFKFFVLYGRICGRTHGYRWSSVKVRERKYKREHDGAQVESRGREHISLLQVLLKLTLNDGKGGTR
jgi:hypothetical protein